MMVLIDTSVWIDHLRVNESPLVRLLTQNSVLSHPFVRGELALGNLGSPCKTMQVDFYQRVTRIGATNKNRQVNAS